MTQEVVTPSQTPYLRGKIAFSGVITCLTGLHVGGVEVGVDVGGIDKYVIRNPYNNEPYIPGSSLKGKLRSLIEYASASRALLVEAGGIANTVNVKEVRDLFGTAIARGDGGGQPSRVLFRDATLTADIRDQPVTFYNGLKYTERKAENTLRRITASATPRQIERIPAGTTFNVSMVLNVDEDTINGDLLDVYLGMLELGYGLLSYDGLGGMVSRGYGQVDINWNTVDVLKVADKALQKQNFSPADPKNVQFAEVREFAKTLNWS